MNIRSTLQSNSSFLLATFTVTATIAFLRLRMAGRPEKVSKTVLTPLPPVERISDLVTRVIGQNPGKFTLLGTNTYLVGTGNGGRILIDTGEGKPEYTQVLKETLKAEGDNVSISDILITHWHADHVGGIADVKRLFPNAKVWKHPLRQGTEQLECKEELDPTGEPYSLLTDGQAFSIPGSVDATLSIMFTPGHTQDHASILLYSDDGSSQLGFFSGDCILGEGSAVFEELHQYLGTLQKIQKRLEDSPTPVAIFPGHGPVVGNGALKVREYIAHRMERERQVLESLRSGPSVGMVPSEMVEVIYKEMNLGDVLKRAAAKSVTQHLLKLEKDGKVTHLENRWKLTLPSKF